MLKYSEDQEVVRAAGLESRGMTGRAFKARSTSPQLVAASAAACTTPACPSRGTASARSPRRSRVTEPVARRRGYWTAGAVLASDPAQARAFDSVFSSSSAARCSTGRDPDGGCAATDARPARGTAGPRPAASPAPGRSAPWRGMERAARCRAVAASDEERLRDKRFDALEPAELAALYRLMGELEVATPIRRTRRRASATARGDRLDLRRTLRAACARAAIRSALRAGAAGVRRRIVLLCDISGSMEPYARAYLQFLTCAAGSGPHAEAFVFATRSPASRARSRRAAPSARSSAPRLRRRTGPAARASATRCVRSTTATAGAAWPAARSS